MPVRMHAHPLAQGIGRLLAALMVALVTLPIPPTPPAEASTSSAEFEWCLLDEINASRALVGAGPLQLSPEVSEGAREWSVWMSSHTFRHMTTAERDPMLPDGTRAWAENIAQHSNGGIGCSTIHSMLMNSSGHRANILNPTMTFVGLGAHRASNGWWVTEVFFDAPGYSVACDGTFCDDDGSVFEPSIEAVAAAGITRGCNPPANTEYCPDGHVTRGQMAAFLTRALDLPAGSTTFTDTGGSVFEADIAAVAAAGITRGCNPPANTEYCPDAFVTRGQMAAFIARALDLPPASTPTFSDTVTSPFRSDITRIAAAGITLGCNPPSNTNYCPSDRVTRGQLAAFLQRALGL